MTTTTSQAATQIPVIDIADLGRPATRQAIDSACREWGVFQVINHGVEPGALVDLLAEQQQFFDLPRSEKCRIERTAQNPWGYYDQELTKNRLDWKQIFDVGQANGAEQPQWPNDQASFRAQVLAVYAGAEALARRLLEVVAQNLGAQAQALNPSFVDHTSFLRLNYYPVCDTPAAADAPTVPLSGHLGISHHTDAGAITVLLQDDQPGLQVQRHDRWYTVESHPGALVINLGDIAQVWSNDAYRAPLHRVLANSVRARRSAAFFFNPSYSAIYAPLAGQCVTQPARYRSIGWRDFRAQRTAGDYADYGEEIQIADYRINP